MFGRLVPSGGSFSTVEREIMEALTLFGTLVCGNLLIAAILQWLAHQGDQPGAGW